MNNDAIPGIIPGPPVLEQGAPVEGTPWKPDQAFLDRLWRRHRIFKVREVPDSRYPYSTYRVEARIEMPRITSRYHRTVLLKNWLEGA